MSILLRLLRLATPERGSLLLAVLLSAAAVLSGIALTAVAAYLIAKGAVVDDVAALSIAFAAVRGLAVSRAGFRYLERLVAHSLTLRILTGLRTWFYAAVEPLAPAALTRYRSGDLASRAVADVQTLEGMYVRVVVPPVAAAIAITGIGLLYGAFDWAMSLYVVALMLVVGIALPMTARRLARPYSEAAIKARAGLHAAGVDDVRGVADVLLLDAYARRRSQSDALGEVLDRAQQRLAFIRGLCSGATILCVGAAAIGVLLLAIPAVEEGRIDGVYLAMLALVAVAGFESVQSLPAGLQHLEDSLVAGRRIFDVLDAPAAVQPPARSAVARDCDLEFRDVFFRYATSERDALGGLSFRLEPGKVLAIIGDSGSGKTTIANLLLRFWEPTHGEIRFGAHDLNDYDPDFLRSYLGVVPQDVHLFNGTILDNLQVADAYATQAQIEDAAERAQLADLIASLPQGYDTVVGENGLLLSGGQRQLIAVARMLLKDAPFFVLDEPTANLDPAKEAALVASLRASLAGKTGLVFSHRPAVWALADEVIELRAGRIARRTPSSS